MIRRHSVLSSLILLAVFSTSASAEDYDTAEARSFDRPRLLGELRIELAHTYHYDRSDWLASVTMRDLPEGSLHYRFRGFHRFALRHARSQYRRFVRRAARNGWYVRPEDQDASPLFDNNYERNYVPGFNNGAWWQRAWYDSLPPEKGGAPATPFIQTIGDDTAWSWGPLTVTNSFNVRFDYIAFFELNPNPVETQGSSPEKRATLDIRPAAPTSVTATSFKFDIKPRVRVGMPRDGNLESLLRELSARASMEVRHRGVPIVQAEIEASWSPQDGPSVTFEVALVNW